MPSLLHRAVHAATSWLPTSANIAEKLTLRGLDYSTSRMPRNSMVRSMDSEFWGKRRELAWNTAYDLEQNLSLAGWMVRLHQNFVALLQFCPRTDSPSYNRELRIWYIESTAKKRWDVQRRLSLDRMFVTYEGLKVLSGYALILKVREGRGQLMEAWQIARGEGIERDEKRLGVKVNRNGIVLDQNGAIEWVALASGANSNAMRHEYLAHHTEVILDGFSTRSGTANTLWESPVISAFNKASDLLDADEYTMLKMKLHAFCGLLRTRAATQNSGTDLPVYPTPLIPATQAVPPSNTTDTATGNPRPSPQLEFRPGLVFDGDQGDDIKLLESKTPSTEYIEACKKFTREILSTLGIPYGFYDSEGTTYTTLRADHNRYRDTVKQPRIDLAADKRDAIRHAMRWGVIDSTMPLYTYRGKPKYTVDNLPFNLVPDAKFMLDMGKEFPAIVAQIAAGLKDFETAAHELGNDEYYDTIDRLADQRAYAIGKKVPIQLGSFNYNFDVNVNNDAEEEDGSGKKAKKREEPPVAVPDEDGEE